MIVPETRPASEFQPHMVADFERLRHLSRINRKASLASSHLSLALQLSP